MLDDTGKGTERVIPLAVVSIVGCAAPGLFDNYPKIDLTDLETYIFVFGKWRI